jgi:hypothetical protein
MSAAYPRDSTSPSVEAPVLVTKSDSVNFTRRPRCLLVGTAGTANLVYDDGAGGETVCTNVPLQAGTFVLGGQKRINTGGTATDIWLVF